MGLCRKLEVLGDDHDEEGKSIQHAYQTERAKKEKGIISLYHQLQNIRVLAL